MQAIKHDFHLIFMKEFYAYRATIDINPLLLKDIYIPDIEHANGKGMYLSLIKNKVMPYVENYSVCGFVANYKIVADNVLEIEDREIINKDT